MSQKTHYQDDLFFLSVLVKTLNSGLENDIDPEFFREKILGDIMFLEGDIRRFHGLLSQNAHLIERPEYFKLLERITRALIRSLERLMMGSYPCSEGFAPELTRLKAITEGLQTVLGEIGESIAASGPESSETDRVSEDELSELLRE